MSSDAVITSIATGYKLSTIMLWVSVFVAFIYFLYDWVLRFYTISMQGIKRIKPGRIKIKRFRYHTLLFIISTTFLTQTHATTSYETMSGLMFLVGTALCAFFAVNLTTVKEPFKTSLQIMFMLFSILFLVSGFGSTVQITGNQTGQLSPITTSVATGFKTGNYLLWIIVFVTLIYFLYSFILKFYTISMKGIKRIDVGKVDINKWRPRKR